MNASVTLTLSQNKEFYYGIDNMNNGTEIVDITEVTDEYIRNFVKLSTHMINNDPSASGIATTTIAGTIYKMGDVDSDKLVSIVDATAIQKNLVGKYEFNDITSDLADFDLDGSITIFDATKIQIYLTHN